MKSVHQLGSEDLLLLGILPCMCNHISSDVFPISSCLFAKGIPLTCTDACLWYVHRDFLLADSMWFLVMTHFVRQSYECRTNVSR